MLKRDYFADASDEGVPALSASLGLIEEYVDYELRLGSNFASDGKGAFSKLRMFGEKKSFLYAERFSRLTVVIMTMIE